MISIPVLTLKRLPQYLELLYGFEQEGQDTISAAFGRAYRSAYDSGSQGHLFDRCGWHSQGWSQDQGFDRVHRILPQLERPQFRLFGGCGPPGFFIIGLFGAQAQGFEHRRRF